MAKETVLVTGACGEIGQALVQELGKRGNIRIVTLDLAPLPEELKPLVEEHIQGDLLLRIKRLYEMDFDGIFHLAAFLSSKAEILPEEAHRVNVDGTFELLLLAARKSERRGRAVKFFFPSSIAVYGLPDRKVKEQTVAVREDEWTEPHTLYGCHKLSGEHLGRYFAHYYGQKHLDAHPPAMVDFRALRFPGLISAFTLPSGGTSDYGPEMLHAAAQGRPYACFVDAETRLPFMAMPDAVRAILMLMDAPLERLSRCSYNVGSFNLAAEDFRRWAVQAFPGAEITYAPNPRRQGIVDSWPAAVDDSAARTDWGWQPQYDVDRFFEEYLLPNIRERYHLSLKATI